VDTVGYSLGTFVGTTVVGVAVGEEEGVSVAFVGLAVGIYKVGALVVGLEVMQLDTRVQFEQSEVGKGHTTSPSWQPLTCNLALQTPWLGVSTETIAVFP